MSTSVHLTAVLLQLLGALPEPKKVRLDAALELLHLHAALRFARNAASPLSVSLSEGPLNPTVTDPTQSAIMHVLEIAYYCRIQRSTCIVSDRQRAVEMSRSKPDQVAGVRCRKTCPLFPLAQCGSHLFTCLGLSTLTAHGFRRIRSAEMLPRISRSRL